jgi:hypothetical protein
MPETAIDEDGDASPGKDEIGLSTQMSEWSPMDEVPHTGLVERTSQGDFRSRVPPFLAAHPLVYGFT